MCGLCWWKHILNESPSQPQPIKAEPSTIVPSADIATLTESAPDWFTQAFEVPRYEDHVQVAGTDIHYFRWGNPGNPGVVLTHGFMAHARCWAFIAPLLAENFCVVAFDLSGMGDSGWRDAYSVETRAEECLAVAEHAGITQHSKPHLVCHSYGASVGLTAVTQQPNAWRSFIVCDMTMLAPGEASQFEEHRKAREARGIRPHRPSADRDEILSRFKLTPPQPCDNAFLVEYMAIHSVKPHSQGYIWKFDPRILGMDDERDPDWWSTIAPTFAKLDLPKAIIYGRHSEMMSEQVRAYLRETSGPDLPIIEIADAYHHIMLDQPLALYRVLETQLNNL